MCRISSGWKNEYGNGDNKFTDANDGFLLMTMSVENKNNKKKEVTWYKCKKTGHYSNECGKEETFKTSNNHFIFVCLE